MCNKYCLPADKSPPGKFEIYLVKLIQINNAGKNILKN